MPVPQTVHGTYHGYTTYKCRCHACVSAYDQHTGGRKMTEKTLERLYASHAKRAADLEDIAANATRGGQPWEEWEHDLAADYSLSAREVARRTKRTHSAVRTYRIKHGLLDLWRADMALGIGRAEEYRRRNARQVWGTNGKKETSK